MPINVTLNNSGKVSLQENVIGTNIGIYISSFKIKFKSLPFFTWAVIFYSHSSHKKLKI